MILVNWKITNITQAIALPVRFCGKKKQMKHLIYCEIQNDVQNRNNMNKNKNKKHIAPTGIPISF